MSSSIKANPNTFVVVNVYDYNHDTVSYSPAGKSGLLKAPQCLHINVSDVISEPPHEKAFDHKSVPGLEDYRPYHNDLNLEVQYPDQHIHQIILTMVITSQNQAPHAVVLKMKTHT